ncbi:aromatic amino acid transport family protein [Candidatus Similichlamydia laticola]|uniref:Tyrosine-specific transport protein n=1 Tax=Candidatus Similichlamydia laticola TaxID=2170265 RepID=A0A369K9Z3_9BACT|nr:aromatic amino acid transport family protein [Candidatus Similichlamydia laticola]RDB31419.1 Tyrosine-specific transport protein [Candidatus Similichlamydia laticola]
MFSKRCFFHLRECFKECLFNREFWNASLLVIGTCVGGGITILPSVMAEQGCLIGLATLTLSALFAMVSSLLLLEIFSFVKEPTHFFSLFEKNLPRGLHTVAILIYTFICLASIVAYISGIASQLIFLYFPSHVWSCLFVTFLGLFLLNLPRKILMQINAHLVRLLFICFFFLLLYMVGLFNWRSISWIRREGALLTSLPICLTSFSHQMIIPSLQMSCHKSLLKPAICFGIFMTWFIYVCWILFSFGTLPLEGPNSLTESYQGSIPITISLTHLLNSDLLSLLSTVFSILVLFTSFIGVSLAFLDFFTESLSQSSPFQKRVRELSSIVLLPSCLFACFIPKIFLYALDLSGGIGDASLYGLLPAYLVFSGAKRGLFTMNLLHWTKAFFLFLVGSISLGLEFKYLFFG